MIIDMHVHTTNSDGMFNVQEVLEKANNNNLNVLSITDHDSIVDLSKEVEKFDFDFIQGIEFTTDYKRVHILGYRIKDIARLNKVALKYRNKAEAKVLEVINLLLHQGYNFEVGDVYRFSKNNRITINSICRVLISKNIFNSYEEVKEKTGIGKVIIPRISIEEAIKEIKNCGGKAILAHPYCSKFKEENIEKEIKKIMEYGLDGIEAYYMRSKPYQIENMIRFAKKNNLLKTVGTDFHGYGDKNSLGVEIDYNLEL